MLFQDMTVAFSIIRRETVVPRVIRLTTPTVYLSILLLEFREDLESLTDRVRYVAHEGRQVHLAMEDGLVVQLTYTEVARLVVDRFGVEIGLLTEDSYGDAPVYSVLLSVEVHELGYHTSLVKIYLRV